MRNRRALVTLTLGARHRNHWLRHARGSWQRYVRRHGFDLVVLEQPLDDSARARARSPAWQKLLTLGQPSVCEYEQVAWVDSDIIIHPDAPSVFEGVPLDKVGAVEEFRNPTPEIYIEALRRAYAAQSMGGVFFVRCETPLSFYQAYGFEDGFDEVVHTGVMVLSPRHHRELLERVYRDYEDVPDRLMEMRPLSYELMKAVCVHWIDPRFNLIWDFYKAARYPFLFGYPEHPMGQRCAAYAFAESYFLHFAGNNGQMLLVDAEAPVSLPRRSWLARGRSLEEIAPPVCETPIAILLHSRPEAVSQVLAAVRSVRPRRLFLIADGPRADVEGEAERCAAARAVAENVDWECEVRRHYAAENLGIKARVDSGLAWLFEQVEEAVILEDDCVPHPSFFRFCEELLARHRDDPRVMSICGTDFKFGLSETPSSYTFSRYPLIWGWATWRRAWKLYDPRMTEWPRVRDSGALRELVDGPYAFDYWAMELQQNFETLENWDYAWLLSSWLHGGLSIHPAANLVTNIGFGAGATHTHEEHHILANLSTEEMAFPLVHPPSVARDAAADEMIEENAFSGVLRRLWVRLRKRRRERRSAAGE